jgi:hypothetical protein
MKLSKFGWQVFYFGIIFGASCIVVIHSLTSGVYFLYINDIKIGLALIFIAVMLTCFNIWTLKKQEYLNENSKTSS